MRVIFQKKIFVYLVTIPNTAITIIQYMFYIKNKASFSKEQEFSDQKWHFLLNVITKLVSILTESAMYVCWIVQYC